MTSTIPLEVIQTHIGSAIEGARKDRDMRLVLELVSIAEYLKDAERWQWVRENELPSNSIAGKELDLFVDQQLHEK